MQEQPADPQHQGLLQQAMAHLSRNEFPPAEALLNRALAVAPDDCDTLHLFGQMRRVQGRFGEAEDFYRRALAIEPARAELHYHMGQLQVLTGRYGAAAASQQEAIRLKPNLALAHLELGAVLVQIGDPTGAEAAYRQALKLQPNLLTAKQMLGTFLILQNRPKEAETILRSGLAQARNDPATFASLEHNLAIAVSAQHRHEEALALFAETDAIMPGQPQLECNRANALQALGRYDEAIASYRKELSANPLEYWAHRNLSQLLYRMGREDFLSSYDTAIKAQPGLAQLVAEKAQFLITIERHDDAREAFARTLALEPSHGGARSGLAAALTGLGQYEDAIREYEHLLHTYPDHVEVRCDFAECLSRAGDPQKALKVAEEALERDPDHQLVIALKSIALRQMGEEEKTTFDDYESLVQVFDLEPPEGFSDMESFNRELENYLVTLHRDTREHINQTSRHGTKAPGTLFGSGHEIVERLQVRIAEAVNTYIERMGSDETHPLFSRRRNGFGYSGSWSTRLSDGGYHAGHVHPRGWISSAYYVALPDVVADEDAKQGWLKFGEPRFAVPGLENQIRRMVQPAPGRLVLFPSYMWHGTMPFHAQQTRTAIAFDAIPA